MKKIYKLIAVFTVILLAVMSLNEIHVAASSGSMIGPIDVSGMSKKQMTKEVREMVEVWQQKEISIQGGSEEVVVSGEVFNFDVSRSVDRLNKAQKKPWYDFWSAKPDVKSELIVHATEKLINTVEPIVGDNLDEVMESLLEQAATLPIQPLKITKADFDISEGKLVSSAALPIESENVDELTVIADKLNEYTLQPNTDFSFLAVLGKKLGKKNASLAATALYNNALQSGFEVSQRHQADCIQNYVEAGYEASLNAGKSQDLIFSSTRQGPVKIQASVKNNQFYVDFYISASEELPEIKLYTANEETITPKVIYRYTDKLSMGESKEVRQASEGITVDVYRQMTTIEYGTEKKLISTNYYAPIHQVILKSMEEMPADDSTLEDFSGDMDAEFTQEPNDTLGEDSINDEENVTAVEGLTEEDTIQLDDQNKLVIEKIENPTAEQLSEENVIYSEANDSYYYIYTVDGSEEGDK
ncbi:MAG: VanW family protein [Kurthia sp.]|nr:VanW family protein [Candidatus Kurthia equi]